MKDTEALERELNSAVTHGLEMSRELTRSQMARTQLRERLLLVSKLAQAQDLLICALTAGAPTEELRKSVAQITLEIAQAAAPEGS